MEYIYIDLPPDEGWKWSGYGENHRGVTPVSHTPGRGGQGAGSGHEARGGQRNPSTPHVSRAGHTDSRASGLGQIPGWVHWSSHSRDGWVSVCLYISLVPVPALLAVRHFYTSDINPRGHLGQCVPYGTEQCVFFTKELSLSLRAEKRVSIDLCLIVLFLELVKFARLSKRPFKIHWIESPRTISNFSIEFDESYCSLNLQLSYTS